MVPSPIFPTATIWGELGWEKVSGPKSPSRFFTSKEGLVVFSSALSLVQIGFLYHCPFGTVMLRTDHSSRPEQSRKMAYFSMFLVITFVFLAASSHCWLLFNMWLIRTPDPFHKYYFQARFPIIYSCFTFFPLRRWITLHVLLLNTIVFISAHCWSLTICFWIFLLSSEILIIFPSFVQSANIISASTAIIQVIDKNDEKHRAQAQPNSAPCNTSFHAKME